LGGKKAKRGERVERGSDAGTEQDNMRVQPGEAETEEDADVAGVMRGPAAR